MDKLLRRLDTPFMRFLLVGGVNTALGYLVTLLLHYGLHLNVQLAQVLNFVICFPIAYTLQSLFAFGVPWSWKRLLLYPLSNIPSLLIQLLVTTVAVEWLGLPAYAAYLLSYIIAIPVMFVVVRYLVGAKKSKTD
ncbi:MAG: GtrA family protein [Peptoniphilaceae bacterium]|jgi:putative flippase GtrA|nr:GtrA family protein [Bacillota bacterium]